MSATNPSSVFARTAHEIQTPRLILRTAVESDAEAYHELKRHPANFPYDKHNPNITVEELRQSIIKLQHKSAQGEYALLVWTLRETGKVIGFGGYNSFEAVEPADFLNNPDLPAGAKFKADLGLTIDHRYWRKGYGLEAMTALIEYANKDLGCELFLMETDEHNQPWRSLMHAAGLGDAETWGKPDDDDEELWMWKFDTAQWTEAKRKLRADGKWVP